MPFLSPNQQCQSTITTTPTIRTQHHNEVKTVSQWPLTGGGDLDLDLASDLRRGLRDRDLAVPAAAAAASAAWLSSSTRSMPRNLLSVDTTPARLVCASMRHLSTWHDTHTHTRLTALCPGQPGWAGTRKVKTNLDFTEAWDSANPSHCSLSFSSSGLLHDSPDFYCYFWAMAYPFLLFSFSVLHFLVVVSVR